MRVLLFIPVVLSLLALAAHFLRAGNPLLVLACLGLVGLVAVRRPWAGRLLQAALALGALEWLRVLLARVAERQAMGETWQRLAIILGAVALMAALSVAALASSTMRAHFRPDRGGESAPGSDRSRTVAKRPGES